MDAVIGNGRHRPHKHEVWPRADEPVVVVRRALADDRIVADL